MITKSYIKIYPDFYRYYYLDIHKIINTNKKYHSKNTLKLLSKFVLKNTCNYTYTNSLLTSIRRTKTTITDLTLCNKFTDFITLTIDPKKLDRYDQILCKKKLTQWLNNQQKYYGKFKYLVVPELHKDGAIHFHILVKDSKIPKKRAKTRGIVYNLNTWKYGYSTQIPIRDYKKTSSYIRKYITKEFIDQKGKKRYFHSNNLVKPKTIKNDIPLTILENNIPDPIYQKNGITIFQINNVSLNRNNNKEIQAWTKIYQNSLQAQQLLPEQQKQVCLIK